MERLRAIPPGFDPVRLTEVDERLAAIAREHAVSIGFAIESGSRAWGFPSPDSDYDCRFVFVRPAADYLTPWPRRDVIETPLENDLDINGWDLLKALKLLLKGNAVIIEWLVSPIVYDGDPAFRAALQQFARTHASRDGIARHYLHLGQRQRATYFADGKAVQLKKLFYALRPAASLRWLRMHPGEQIPPMHFPTLMEECNAPEDVRELVKELIARKAVTRELGAAPLPRAIETFVDGEFALAKDALSLQPVRLTRRARESAENLFRHWVARLADQRGSTSTSLDPK